VEVIEAKRGLLTAAAKLLQKVSVRQAGYEEASLTCAGFAELKHAVGSRVKFKPVRGLVEGLRMVKDQEEIRHIRAAGEITAAAFAEVLGLVRPGVAELDLAAEIEYRMRKKGAEGAAFETIVASGPRGASPHARTSSKLLGKDELVILDLGAILAGYAADMTRTLYLGRPNRRVRGFYDAVVVAQRQAVETVRPGVPAGRVDAAARRVLASRGVGKYFTHSTGHGVGLEVHEKPRVARGERTLLKDGCVITVEPGIYLEGYGGIRLEDTLLVGRQGSEILTPAPKDHWVIN
jgi:Xaa-Pro aminopeptidase